MYLTFFTKAASKQISFEDLLSDPYMSLDKIKNTTQKKVTVAITEEYAEKLFKKRPNIIADTPFPFNHIINDMDTSEHYKHFEIPKRGSNKTRPIDAPDAVLGTIQSTFKVWIEESMKVLPHKAAHAYVAERSTITAMKEHQKNESKWFLQLDLKNFFNSINEDFLRKMLKEVYPFKFVMKENMDAIIKAALLNGSLPQGSHLSPTLTNLIMVPIDHMITENLNNYKKKHYVYTRYADDITISCKYKFDWREIKQVVESVFEVWDVPFKINEEKTRFGSSAGRNYHVGLILNKDNQISVGHEKNNKFKAMIFNFCTTGEAWEIHDVQKMLGLISYYKSIEPDFVKKIINKYNKKFNIDIMFIAKNMIK